MTNPVSASPPLLSVRAASAYIGVSRSRIYELFGDGSIRALKLGSRTLVTRAELDAFLTKLPTAEFRSLSIKGRRS